MTSRYDGRSIFVSGETAIKRIREVAADPNHWRADVDAFDDLVRAAADGELTIWWLDVNLERQPVPIGRWKRALLTDDGMSRYTDLCRYEVRRDELEQLLQLLQLLGPASAPPISAKASKPERVTVKQWLLDRAKCTPHPLKSSDREIFRDAKAQIGASWRQVQKAFEDLPNKYKHSVGKPPKSSR